MKKGFSLLEIIVVIVIVSLFFATIISSYLFVINKSLNIIKNSNVLYKNVNALYNIEKAIECAKDIKIDNTKEQSIVFIYTFCGMYKGFSKEVLFVKNGYLYVYTYPYKFGNIFFYDKAKSTKLIPVENFKAKFIISNYKIIELNINGAIHYIPILLLNKP